MCNVCTVQLVYTNEAGRPGDEAIVGTVATFAYTHTNPLVVGTQYAHTYRISGYFHRMEIFSFFRELIWDHENNNSKILVGNISTGECQNDRHKNIYFI